MRVKLVKLLVWITFSTMCYAQSATTPLPGPGQETGYKPFGSFGFGAFDSVNYVNLKLDLHIPLINYPQRGGKLKLGFDLAYSSASFGYSFYNYPRSVSCHGATITCETDQFDFRPTATGGLYVRPLFGAYAGDPTNPAYSTLGTPADGTHVMVPSTDGGHYYAVDSSGYQMTVHDVRCPQSMSSVTSADGVTNCDPQQPFTLYTNNKIIDAAGNSIVNNAPSSVSVTDSVGRTIPLPPFIAGTVQSTTLDSWTTDYSGCIGSNPIVAALLWSLPGYQGQTLTYKFCFIANNAGRQISCEDILTLPDEQGGVIDNCPNSSSTVYGPPSGVGDPVGSADTTGNVPFQFIQSIVLSDGTAWGFQFDPIYGDLKVLTLPTGGTITYSWTDFVADGGNCGLPYVQNISYSHSLASRTVDANDGTGPHTWTYTQIGPPPSTYGNGIIVPYSVQEGNPDGSYTIHTFSNLALYGTSCSYYETSTKNFSSNGLLLKEVDKSYSTVSTTLTLGSTTTTVAKTSPEVTSIKTILDNGQQSEIDRDYDAGVSVAIADPIVGGTGAGSVKMSNVVAERAYDYSSGAPGNLLRATGTQYLWQTNSSYLAAGLVDLVSSSCIAPVGQSACTSSSTDSASYTNYGYDESGSPSGARGNQTSTHAWLNTGSQLVSTQTIYSSTLYGMPTSHQDANGNWITYGYDGSGMFLNSFVQPVTNGVSHSDYYSYDLNTGLMLSHADENASGPTDTTHTTNYSYDILGRLTGRTYPDGGGETISFNGYPTPPHITATKVTGESSGPIVTDYFFDGAGRLQTKKLTSNPAGAIAVTTSYDSMGRLRSVTNPYISTSDVTYGYMVNSYDGLGRMVGQQHQPDQTSLLWSYTGNQTDAWDEAGVHTQNWTDTLGRLSKVIEAGTASNPLSLQTVYTYDSRNNLTAVNQAGGGGDTPRIRRFAYDSLSRLTNVCNPESLPTGQLCDGVSNWSSVYSYNANGNVTSKSDARGVTTGYIYDALNRLNYKNFNDGTPTDAFGYDGKDEAGNTLATTVTNPVGRLSHISNGVNAAVNYGYDMMGRPTTAAFCLPSDCSYGVSATAIYDLAGNVSSLTYPDGMQIKQTWDAAGRFATASLGTAGANQAYISSTTYNPDGSQNVMTLGNGVQQTVTENKRLQVANITVANPLLPMTTPFLSHDYCYVNCTFGGVANNGNIWEVQDTLKSSNTQDFTYDNLNRLKNFYLGSALNTSYNVDSFGNMSALVNGQQVYTFDSSNRINNLPCAATLPPFDSAGNQICDTDTNGALRRYSFDAESRIKQISMYGSSSPFVSYVYGGDGSRVRKTNADGTFTEYVEFAGQPIAEKNQTGGWTDYIYANGKKIARLDNSDMALHFQGTACSGCVSSRTGGYLTAVLNNYYVKAGDKIVWRQFENSASQAGMAFWFWNCTGSGVGGGADSNAFDTDGQSLLNDGIQNQWHQRTFDLTPYAGCQIQTHALGLMTLSGPIQSEAWFADIAIVSGDGSVTPFYHRNAFLPTMTLQYPSTDVTNVSVTVDNTMVPPASESTPFTTTYFVGDHLGTAQLELSSTGWPMWQGQFAPFGQEMDNQATTNHYKFTGKERDSESGLDYFGARYYASSAGRWMSPDWSAKEEPVPYSKLDNPQSLNLYQYVGNNPLTGIDADGHETETYNDGTLNRTTQQNAPMSHTEMKIWGGLTVGAAMAVGAGELAAFGRVLLGLAAANAPLIQHTNEMLQDAASPPGSPSVWSLTPMARGVEIESQLAVTEYKSWGHIGAELGGKSEMFDFVKGNTLVSLKTADTMSGSFLSNAQRTIRLIAGSGAEVGGQPTNLALDLRVQPGGAKAAQSLIDYGSKRGVTVTIKEYH